MPNGLKIGLIVSTVAVVGWVIWVASQPGDVKTKLDLDNRVGDSTATPGANLAGDLARAMGSETGRTPGRKNNRTTKNQAPQKQRTVIPPSNRRETSPAGSTRALHAAGKRAPDTASRTPAGGSTPSVGPTRGNDAAHTPTTEPPPRRSAATGEPRVAGAATDVPQKTPETSSDRRSTPSPTAAERPKLEASVPEARPADPRVVTTEPPARRSERGARHTAPSKPMESHEIQPGDTLIYLARDYYNDQALWKAIKQANPGLDESRLAIGQKILIPAVADARRMASGGARPATGGARSATSAPRRGLTGSGSELRYVVEPGDSLSKIAREQFNDAKRWREIFELNRDRLDSPDTLRVGMELKLPKE